MTKASIVYYTKDRIPLSLGNLMLKRGKFVEDIFDALEDSEDFDELTVNLTAVLDERFTEDRRMDNYIRYRITDSLGNISFLKFKIKEAQNG